jgi:hypothetical protein
VLSLARAGVSAEPSHAPPFTADIVSRDAAGLVTGSLLIDGDNGGALFAVTPKSLWPTSSVSPLTTR